MTMRPTTIERPQTPDPDALHSARLALLKEEYRRDDSLARRNLDAAAELMLADLPTAYAVAHEEVDEEERDGERFDGMS